MNYIKVDEGNKSDFSSVLPEFFVDGKGVSLAAYDDDGGVCGAISLSCGGGQYDLDWIYVVPEKRRMGIGKSLVKEVKKMIGVLGICPVRAQFDATEDNGLYGFFLSIPDADLLVDLDYTNDRYAVPAGDFVGSDVMKQKVRMDYVPVYFWDMDEEKKNAGLDIAARHLVITDPEAFEESCEKKLCYATCDDERILSLMLVQKDDGGNLHLTFLYAVSGKALIAILKPAAREVKKNYGKSLIIFDTVTGESERIARKVFPDAVQRKIYEAEF